MFGFLAQLLAWCYDVWPNYLGMILLFTLIVMAAVTPFTIKGMRSAAEMARIQPEMKKIQDQYKNDRIKQNEEMQALFKEHGVNPLGGCLPTLLPLPIFFIIFRLLERLNSRHNGALAPLVRLVRHQAAGSAGYVSPHYLTYKSTLTQHLIASNGTMKAFGFDLASTARAHHPSVGSAIPYYVLIVVMTASQYWQQRQINKRNPAAANANPQMKMTMQLFPAFYALISLNIAASVVVYLLVSGLFRMAQNTLSYRFDPVMARAATATAGGPIEATSRAKGGGSAGPALGKGAGGPGGSGRGGGGGKSVSKPAADAPAPVGFMERLRAQAAEAKAASNSRAQANGANGSGRAAADSGGRSKQDRVEARQDRVEPKEARVDPKRDRDDGVGGPVRDGAGRSEGAPGRDDGLAGSTTPVTGATRSPLSVRPSGRVTPPKGGAGRGRRQKRGR